MLNKISSLYPIYNIISLYRSWHLCLYCTILLVAINFSAGVCIAENKDVYVAQAEKYLNSVRSLQAKFTQLGPSKGEKRTGMFFLSKPGKIRWDYLSPTKVSMIGVDGQITYHDYEMDETSHIRDKDAILNLLTRDKVNLQNSKDFKVLAATKGVQDLEITLFYNHTRGEDELPGTMVLKFSLIPETILERIILLDQDGSPPTEILFSDIKHNISIPNSIFSFKNDSFFKLRGDD